MQNELFKALGRCHVIGEAEAQFQFNLTLEGIDELISDKYLKRDTTENGVIYLYLTEKGEKKLKEENPEFQEIYRGVIVNHDLVLMDFYLRCTDFEKNNWFTRDDMIKEFQLPGTLDAGFVTSSGVFEGVEVLKNTANYSVVEKSETFATAVGIQKMNYLMYKV